MPNPSDDRFLGALLGLAIGDALGMPVAGKPRPTEERGDPPITTYQPRRLADGTEIAAGEVTDETESVLSIVEGMTTTAGAIDPETIGPRLLHLAAGDSRRWFPAATLAALDRAADSLSFEVPLDEDGAAKADVAVRGVPVGLLHAVGPLEMSALKTDVERVVRLTDGSTTTITAAEALALAIRLAARGEEPPERWPMVIADGVGAGTTAVQLLALQCRLDAGESKRLPIDVDGAVGDATSAVLIALQATILATDFESAVLSVVNLGGNADTLGAMVGALAGTRFGSAGIPQPLIDGLGSRIYISLAAPWFFKTAQRRAGIIIDLRPRLGGPRPPMPPRI